MSSRTFPGHGYSRTSVCDVGREVKVGLLELLLVVAEVVRRDHVDVFPPLAKRRDPDLDHVQTVEEILAEPPLADLVADFTIGRRDDADIDRDLLVAAETPELLRVEELEELRLGLRVRLGDLVEKKRPVVGELDEADLLRLRVGERARLVAE